ncbi:kinase-like protein [Westerdykella ornata]|uniref:Kinase-like protein n=1 Tax=Westerdykella ornata TaxID=318751 RepID=A0A6A6JDZ7_WESOR|nr:kinase-like protein [Westerdykella ornata]KAF2273876.1 kinase-like protein [Westerdykella ornata]
MAGDIVAYLQVKLAGRDTEDTRSGIEIYGSEQFYLGRQFSACRRSWPDPVISNRHLRIHCILYEQDPVSGIPPFVYATDLSTNGTYLKKANSECASSQSGGIRMTRNSAFLLDDGDELRLSDSVTLVYRSVTPVREEVLTPVQQRERQMFARRYLITGRVLGAGGFGKVMVGYHQKTQRQVACKIIDLRRIWPKQPPSRLRYPSKYHEQSQGNNGAHTSHLPDRVKKCFREFEILKDLSHPNVIAIEKVFWSNDTIYIFQDLVSGGDLFSYLEYKGGKLNDMETAVIIRQVLKGVEYLHGQSIVHRDLKPDNILMTSLDDGCRIVISDFGNARYLPGHPTDLCISSTANNRRMLSYAGTMEYAAPEIHKKNKSIPAGAGYSMAVDMWSIGAITGTLLSGDVIFAPPGCPRSDPMYCEALLDVAARCDLSFLQDNTHPVWRNVGPRPKDFIRNLLVLQEDRRMTATQALTHPWFSNSYHAAAFDALYEKSVRDWQARRSNCGLVEPVAVTGHLPQSRSKRPLLTKDVLSRHFRRRRGSSTHKSNRQVAASQLRRANSPLPSLPESHEEECAQRLPQVPDSYHHIQSVCANQQLSKQSAEQYSLPLRISARYMSHGMRNDPPGSCHQVDEIMSTEWCSEYNFSVPAPPPETPSEEDPVLVPETPVHRRKRDRRTFAPDALSDNSKTVNEHEEVQDARESTVYFANLTKRRRLRCTPA